MDSGRKDENGDADADAEVENEGPPGRGPRRVCARYDSSPELKAKDPSGRAESESRRR